MIKLGNLHSASLCAELQLWWLNFLLYHCFVWLCLRGGHFTSVCVKSW